MTQILLSIIVFANVIVVFTKALASVQRVKEVLEMCIRDRYKIVLDFTAFRKQIPINLVIDTKHRPRKTYIFKFSVCGGIMSVNQDQNCV